MVFVYSQKCITKSIFFCNEISLTVEIKKKKTHPVAPIHFFAFELINLKFKFAMRQQNFNEAYVFDVVSLFLLIFKELKE